MSTFSTLLAAIKISLLILGIFLETNSSCHYIIHDMTESGPSKNSNLNKKLTKLQLLKHDLSKQLGAGSTNYIGQKRPPNGSFPTKFRGLPKFHVSAETGQCIVHHVGIHKRKCVSKVIKTNHHSPQLHTPKKPINYTPLERKDGATPMYYS